MNYYLATRPLFSLTLARFSSADAAAVLSLLWPRSRAARGRAS